MTPGSISKSQALLQQVLGVELSRASIVRSLQRVSAALEQPTTAAHRAMQQQPVVYVDETVAPTGNSDGRKPTGKRGWLWVAMSPVVTVFLQGLSRSAAAAAERLGQGFGGIVVSDRFSAYNHLPTHQRQLCWAHLIRDLTAIAERSGANADFGAQLLELQQQLFEQWHLDKDIIISWPVLQLSCRPIRLAFEAML